ncbi:helix-turn-helix domain-containing protein [Paenibacillus sp.]|uniref:helix-turn-helix domain-containing protein n=1 Tax=Paenibacillus sp. TaxID=58172 RepID=UPI00281271F3|nr:helix-turn-helix domain-containing protein [Paenibacillus sp.]
MKKYLKDVHSLEELNAFFARMLTDACYHIAEKLDITGGYLSTYFKEKTGMNFLDAVNDVRIRKARELLDRASGLKIQDVAARVGYQNLNSFNRMFKKFTGLTPSEYRQEGGARGGGSKSEE